MCSKLGKTRIQYIPNDAQKYHLEKFFVKPKKKKLKIIFFSTTYCEVIELEKKYDRLNFKI